MRRLLDPILIASVTAVLFSFFYFMDIVILHVPPVLGPWIVSILGAVAMVGLTIKLALDGDHPKLALFWALLFFTLSFIQATGAFVSWVTGHPF